MSTPGEVPAGSAGAPVLENRTFEEIEVGDRVSLVHTVTARDIQLFAVVSGDVNPAHLDAEYASGTFFREIIAHGMLGGALISTVLGTRLPGPGTIYVSQSLQFLRPVHIGDQVTVTLTVVEKRAEDRRVFLDCSCVNQQGQVVVGGRAEVLPPKKKLRRVAPALPEVFVHDREAAYRQVLERARGQGTIRIAVVHPCDTPSLEGAALAAAQGLAEPVLVGPAARIRALAARAGIGLEGMELVDVPHSEAAATQAVRLARAGRVDALLQGSLRMREVTQAARAPGEGLGGERRMSHVFIFSLPAYPRPLLVTDAELNLAPDLATRADIVRNVIDVARAIGIARPRVALLSASELVTPELPSTLEAAALCKMAERGQITGGILDGPLEFDHAVSLIAARAEGLESAVAGQADALVAPDLESASLLAKQLRHLAHAVGVGVIAGARVPIVLCSRLDSARQRAAGTGIALMLARTPPGAGLAP
jgi:phosphate acetyltransferase/phosphate butyryltransferase